MPDSFWQALEADGELGDANVELLLCADGVGARLLLGDMELRGERVQRAELPLAVRYHREGPGTGGAPPPAAAVHALCAVGTTVRFSVESDGGAAAEEEGAPGSDGDAGAAEADEEFGEDGDGDAG
jgi:hypothetical protein